jgi:SAM-dependent methyltransferase
MTQEQYLHEIEDKMRLWRTKPVLREIYNAFYHLINQNASPNADGLTVEIGSGIGRLKAVIPHCICTDIFKNPYIDRAENAYTLSFADSSLSNLILFDVFHHLEYPGTALQEFHRVLKPQGRVILFDPAISLLGFLVYGACHKEPINYRKKINWFAPDGFCPERSGYYAAQGNASRIFHSGAYARLLKDWDQTRSIKLSALSYVASGGYGTLQLYPDSLLPILKIADGICDMLPRVFATRTLVVLEKR